MTDKTAELAAEVEQLAEVIRTRLLGVHPDDQDVDLEDDDWRIILTALDRPKPAVPADGLREALADLTDAFLSRHGCFPLDQTNDQQRHWHRAMKRAYELVGQPNTPARLAALAAPRSCCEAERAFQIGDRVTKTKGSNWTGRIVGTYSTSLTPEGYAIESENEPGSVQIYPATAIRGAD